MMKLNLKKGLARRAMAEGFTLIELLVVIAIIGILSGIVLTSLNSARTKGNDAKVQSQLASARAQAELYYSTNGNYGTTGVAGGAGCTTTATLFTAAASALGLNGLLSTLPAGYYCYGAALPAAGPVTSWVVAATNGTAWNTGATLGWCVDSTGQSKSYTTSTSVVVPFIAGSLTTLGTGICP